MSIYTYILWNFVSGAFLTMALFMGGHVFELKPLLTWLIVGTVVPAYTLWMYRQWVKLTNNSLNE